MKSIEYLSFVSWYIFYIRVNASNEIFEPPNARRASSHRSTQVVFPTFSGALHNESRDHNSYGRLISRPLGSNMSEALLSMFCISQCPPLYFIAIEPSQNIFVKPGVFAWRHLPWSIAAKSAVRVSPEAPSYIDHVIETSIDEILPDVVGVALHCTWQIFIAIHFVHGRFPCSSFFQVQRSCEIVDFASQFPLNTPSRVP